MLRIAKSIASRGFCSRRKAEEYILNGKVMVNNIVITNPATKLSDHDNIMIDGKILPNIPALRLWKFYKPTGYLVANSDPLGRKIIFDIIKLPRVITVGRLDINSEGLLLLTNNGDFARKLELPANNLTRVYKCRCWHTITPEMVQQLARGITVAGIKYGSIIVSNIKKQNANSWCNISLKEGKNREIRKIFAHFGLQVNRLIRVSYGNYKLDQLKPYNLEEIIID